MEQLNKMIEMIKQHAINIYINHYDEYSDKCIINGGPFEIEKDTQDFEEIKTNLDIFFSNYSFYHSFEDVICSCGLHVGKKSLSYYLSGLSLIPVYVLNYMKEKGWIQSNDIEFLHLFFKHRITRISIENTNLFHILMNFFDPEIIINYVDEDKMTILDDVFSVNRFYCVLCENELNLFVNYLEKHHFNFATPNIGMYGEFNYLRDAIQFNFPSLIYRFMKFGLTIPTNTIKDYETKKIKTQNYLILLFCNALKEQQDIFDIECYRCNFIHTCQTIGFCISLGLFDITTTDSDGKTLRYYVNEKRQLGFSLLGEEYDTLTKTF